MDSLEERTQQGEPEANGHGETQAGSVLAYAREMRDEAAAEEARTKVLNVPAYNGRVAVIYGYPEGGYKAVLTGLQKARNGRRERDPDLVLNQNLDVLCACCVSVVGRNEAGELIDLRDDRLLCEDEVPEPPLRFNRKLAALIGLDIPEGLRSETRYVARHLYSPRAERTGVYDGDLTVIHHGDVLYGWLTGSEGDILDALVGE